MAVHVSRFILCVAILVQLLLQQPAPTAAHPGPGSRSSSSGSSSSSSSSSSTSTDTSTSTSTSSSITLACPMVTCVDEVAVGDLTALIHGALATLANAPAIAPCDLSTAMGVDTGPFQAAAAINTAVLAAFACPPGAGAGIPTLCMPAVAELEVLISCICLQDPALINTDTFIDAATEIIACRVSCDCDGFALHPVLLG